MIEIAHTGTRCFTGFTLLVLVLLLVDFVALKAHGSHKVAVKEAPAWSVVWLPAALGFAAWLWWHLDALHGAEVGSL